MSGAGARRRQERRPGAGAVTAGAGLREAPAPVGQTAATVEHSAAAATRTAGWLSSRRSCRCPRRGAG